MALSAPVLGGHLHHLGEVRVGLVLRFDNDGEGRCAGTDGADPPGWRERKASARALANHRDVYVFAAALFYGDAR